MGDDNNGEAPHNCAEDIEFWLEQGLDADEILGCLKTSKGKPLNEGSKTSVAEVIKNILAVLIDKNAKLKVARREREVATSELEVASHAVEKYRIENVRLLGENAGFQATNRVLQGELEKAVVGAPVGLPLLNPKLRSRSKSSKSIKPVAQKETKVESNPEKQASYLDRVCETVRERLGPCARGEDGGECNLLHPRDCTKPACHAKGGREATKCDGWHLFKKYSELKAERKERAHASKERKKAEKLASASKRQGPSKEKPRKGNAHPGTKAASLGQQQRGKKMSQGSSGKTRHNNKGSQVPRVPQPQGHYQQQFYPPGHQEWAANRQPMACYSQAVPQYSIQAAPTVPVYNQFQPLSSQGASGF